MASALKQPVLVVEDDPDNREILQELLEHEGYPVLTAGNGAEGLKVLEQARPGVVLLDLMMPVMDGLEFLRRLRRDTAHSRTPVILISALGLEPAVDPDHGIVGALRKPLDIRALVRMVDRQLPNPA